MIQNKGVNFESKIVGNQLIRSTPVIGHPDVCQQELVLTQEEFVECYKRWILPFTSLLHESKSNVGANWTEV